MALAPGSLIAERFLIETVAGSGGMSTVYRAIDRASGLPVALKLLHAVDTGHNVDRFEREAELLVELHHPGIVAFVARGVAHDFTGDQPFLAMEWLDGEDLCQRLTRGLLSWPEALAVLRRVAAALEVAHRSHIIHRDIKPSNLFLRGGDIHDVTLLDFGIARRTRLSHRMTGTGLMVGTPAYMAPEQARGASDVGPGADVFSLGCVVFECLTGQPPFMAEHLSAVLAKILFEAPAPVRARHPEIPEALADLVGRMLAKNARSRPEDASALLAELASLDPQLGLDGADPMAPSLPARSLPPGWLGAQQRLLSIVVATPPVSPGTEATLVEQDAALQKTKHDSLLAALTDHGAHAQWLVDGSLVATLGEGRGEATDQAALAARCALLVHDRWPEATIALATGRGLLDGHLPAGDVLDRAGKLLRAGSGAGDVAPRRSILLDEVTANLVGERFLIGHAGELRTLLGESSSIDPSRLLLGKPTPCVGREQELTMLTTSLEICIDESEPTAVLVLAPAGLGKSRLRHELLRRLEASHPDLLVLMGRGDPMSAGSSFGLLGQALRSLCGVSLGEPEAARWEKLRLRIGAHLPASSAPRVTEFIGELCGVPFPDENSVKLRTARQDPRIMADQINLAFTELLRAECAAHPVLLILEDLHWGDTLTAKLADHALRELSDCPLMLLSMARPEVKEMFPTVWAAQLQIIHLRSLSRRAAERLVQEVLGGDVPAATVERVVEQADGNPVLLEELIRAAAEGGGEAQPTTAIAILQARITRIDSDARRVLLAASVFGDSFWRGGVASLLGGEQDASLDTCLQALMRTEMIEELRVSRFPGERELRFRHILTRDAVYDLLAEPERRLGHRLVGEHLERMGETDAVVLGEHARRSDDPSRATLYFLRASEQANRGNDLGAALAYAQRGLECGATGEERGALLGMQAAARLWRNELSEALALGEEALSLLPVGGVGWCRVTLTLLFVTTYLGLGERFAALVERLRGVTPTAEAASAYIEAVTILITMASFLGQAAEARFFLARLEALGEAVLDSSLSARGWVSYAHGVYLHWIEGDLWPKAQLSAKAIAAAEEIGDRRLRGLALIALGSAQMGLGAYDDGYRALHEALAMIKTMPDETYLLGLAAAILSMGLTDQGDPRFFDEASAMADVCIRSVAPTSPTAGISHVSLARVLAHRGALPEAEEHARLGLRTLLVQPAMCPIAHAMLIQVLLARGAPDEARAAAEEGLRQLRSVGSCSTALDVLLAAAEAYHAVADTAAAHDALRDAQRRLMERADKIPEAGARRRFLEQVPLNVRILHLAHAWGALEDSLADTARGSMTRGA